MTNDTELKAAVDILKGKLSSFPDHGASDGAAVYNIRFNGAQIAALLAALPSLQQGEAISTAPQDREIDIFVSGPGSRWISNCRWGKPTAAMSGHDTRMRPGIDAVERGIEEPL